MLLTAAGLALAVALFVLLSGDDESEPGSATTPTTQVTEPGDKQPEPKPPEPTKPEVPVIEVKDGESVDGVLELSVDKGDDIRFIVTSDAAYEVHLHGYDLAQDVEAGGKVTFDVPATLDGVFEVELEETVTPIAEITVNP